MPPSEWSALTRAPLEMAEGDADDVGRWTSIRRASAATSDRRPAAVLAVLAASRARPARKI